MIEHILIKNFKSLRHVELTLGRLNLFIGTNTAGKSNFFDAMRVLQGIGNGFTIGEILDGKPKGATSEVWEGIRGGSAEACFVGTDRSEEIHLAASGRLGGSGSGAAEHWEFDIVFTPVDGKVVRERLSAGGEIYDSNSVKNPKGAPYFGVRYYGGRSGTQPDLTFERSRPMLGQFARGNGKWSRTHAELASQVAITLADTQRLDPLPVRLRDYSQAHRIGRMGEHGENFAALVKTLCEDPKAKNAFLAWLRQLRPREVDDVGTLSGAVGEPLFMLTEGGREFPSLVLSDGTLRFAAITAAFFQPDMPGIMNIEEIEHGFHPSLVRLLVELMRNRSAAGSTQVMASTHSPLVLAWMDEAEYATTFFCKRDESSGESQIAPLTSIPHFLEVVRKQPIAELFAEGWLEAAP